MVKDQKLVNCERKENSKVLCEPQILSSSQWTIVKYELITSVWITSNWISSHYQTRITVLCPTCNNIQWPLVHKIPYPLSQKLCNLSVKIASSAPTKYNAVYLSELQREQQQQQPLFE